MEAVLGSVVVGPVVQCVTESTSSKYRIFRKFRRNLGALWKDVGEVKLLKNELEDMLNSAHKEGKSPTPRVTAWLKDVEAIEAEVNSIEEEVTSNESSFHGCCQNVRLRYRLSKQAMEMSEEVKRLIDSHTRFQNDQLVEITFTPPKAVEPIPAATLITGQTAALDQLLNLLKDDEVGMIGVWGMGGVGKTILVQNLNNKLHQNCSDLAQPFDIVIWVTVSKDLDVRNIQSQVANRLNFHDMSAEDTTERRANLLSDRLNKEKKFLLILDDVWAKVDLRKVGIPRVRGCKIILTTRSRQVCRAIGTDKDVKVNVLSNEDAWKLFSIHAREVVNAEEIKPLAKDVTKECSGLPLAIITVGSAMRGKTAVELWRDALMELQKPAPNIDGIEEEVFVPLKWSYDKLEGHENVKPCFLYCSLYPEDFSIKVDELIQCWVAEGLLDKQLNLEESRDSGIALIEKLKDRCMLESGTEEGTVKMHDVVRDVAIWITASSEGGTGSKFLVRSGMGLSQIREDEICDSDLMRISFADNRITRLPDRIMQCSNVSTLLLQDNEELDEVPKGFLEGFEGLRVLELSNCTRIKSLPPTLEHLKHLRALLLRNCRSLVELPPVGGLERLEILDLNYTISLRELPEGMKELSKLRQLDLTGTFSLEVIKEGTMSSLYSLEKLDMSDSGYEWDTKSDGAKGRTTFEELVSLQNLFEISIWITRKRSQCLAKDNNFGWFKRLRKFLIVVSKIKCTLYDQNREHDQRMVVIARLDLLEMEELEELVSNTDTSSLYLDKCYGITGMCKKIAASEVSCFTGLKSLTISDYSFVNPTDQEHEAKCMPNLENLTLYGVRDVSSMSELMATLGLSFPRLRQLKVVGCESLRILIPFDLSQKLRNLEEIEVDYCNDMTEVIGVGKDDSTKTLKFPSLQTLKLTYLSNLTSICPKATIETLPNLKTIEVSYCPLLKELPQNASTIKVSGCPLLIKERPLSSTQNEKSEDVKGLIASGSKFQTDQLVEITFTPPKAVEPIPAPTSITGQTAALDQLLNLLKDDEVGIIGVWGMGGVGKTTLVQNLNNKLHQNRSNLAQPFDIVIWVTVSKDLDVRNIQSQVANRLNFHAMSAEDTTERRASLLSDRLNKEKKFLLILDDVWAKVDLCKVGIPRVPGCKIILTTRSLDVCREIGTETEIKVDVLSNEDAWKLFSIHAREVVNLDLIKPLAEEVTKECSGLPLAIITVGSAMRGQTVIGVWRDALRELRKSAPHNIDGIEEEVFVPLKWSYDKLEGHENVKPCFLYCSLYPEDFSIKVDELIQCWVAEGLLGKQLNLEESRDSGIALIEKLKDRCMLESGTEEGTVKMHDVVRDVAIWITASSEGGTGSKFLVRSGMGLSQIREDEICDSDLMRISFADNRITSLPDRVMQCSKVSTLLLQRNDHLDKVPRKFLEGFKALRVLDLSYTRIWSLPPTLQHLKQLRALLLRYCKDLMFLTSHLGGLESLEILDLFWATSLKALPEGMKELKKLRQLDLTETWNLQDIKEGTMSSLESLQILDMTGSAYKWDMKSDGAKERATFEELVSLENLFEISIKITRKCSQYLAKGKNFGWFTRWRKFLIVVNSFSGKVYDKNRDRRTVVIEGLNLLEMEELEELVRNTQSSSLVLEDCRGTSGMCKKIGASGMGKKIGASGVSCFTGLKSLTISNMWSERYFLNPTDQEYEAKCDLIMPNLESLTLVRVRAVPSMSELMATLGLSFPRLRLLKVYYCYSLRILIPFDLSQKLRNLEEIQVTYCTNMTELIGVGKEDSTVTDTQLLPRLQTLKLWDLPNLTSICPLSSTIKTLPNLKTIEVSSCPLLKELPQNASTIIVSGCPLLIKEGHLSSTQNESTTKGEIKGDPCSSSSSSSGTS